MEEETKKVLWFWGASTEPFIFPISTKSQVLIT